MALSVRAVVKGNRYRVQELLARGGFGFVYLTFDCLSKRQVVLKELIPALVGDVEILRRFTREGRTMLRLSHPNIARTEGMFKDQGNYYMVLEYVNGGALSDWTDRGRRLSLTRTARVVMALCDALVYLHKRGVTHCDVNPSNVLFDMEGRLKLIDLGIAHVSDELVHRHWHTQRDFPIGTVIYMAPEQLDGVRDDARVDLYAVGVLVYQMLTGRHYLDFDLRNTPAAYAENVNLVRNEIPKPIPNVPPAVEEVIMRSLAKEPSDRYPDVATFCREFMGALVPHLPADEGIRLVMRLRSNSESRAKNLKAAEWPQWVWGALLALDVTIMAVVALLLLYSP